MLVTHGRSEARGALAGSIAIVAGLPCLAIGLVAGLFLQRTMVSRLLGHSIEASDMTQGGTALLAKSVLAALIGFFAAAVSSLIALSLVRQAGSRGFVAVAGTGFVVIALVVWRWLVPHSGGRPASLGLLVGLGWLAAIVALFAAIAYRDDSEEEAKAPGP